MSRILIVSLNFPPEPTSTGKYTGELAAYLGSHGFQVRVITAPPYYPQWKIQPGYKGWQYRHERFGEIEVFRCPLWVPARPSKLNRILHLLSFTLSSLPVLLLQLFWKPDLVLCIAPTLFSAPNALITARLVGAKTWLHIQDFELDAALNLNMLPGLHWFRPLAEAVEKILLKRFARVSTISENMLKRCLSKGVRPERAILLPNWVDSGVIFSLIGENPLRIELGIRPEKVVVLYHGSMGRKQGLEILIKAAEIVQHDRKILFLLSGEGPAKQELEQMAQDLPNVRFGGLQPAEKLNLLVNLADIHVLPQLASAADLVMPSKLTTMLASGKPVIATAQPETEIGRVVGKVGLLVPPENPAALSKAILALSVSPCKRALLGNKGREYVLEVWGEDKVLPRFHAEIQLLLEVKK